MRPSLPVWLRIGAVQLLFRVAVPHSLGGRYSVLLGFPVWVELALVSALLGISLRMS